MKLNDAFSLGCHFTVMTRDPAAFTNKFPKFSESSSLTFLKGDVSTVSFGDEYYDYLVHGAAVSSVWDKSENYLETIVMGTMNVMKWARRIKIEKILFLSSGAVYGENPTEIDRFSETNLSAPQLGAQGSVYGESKRCAEMMVHMFGEAYSDVTIARLFSFYGPLMPKDNHFAFSQFMARAVKHEDIVIKNPNACRSYLYIEDTVQSLIKLLKKNNEYMVYNIGGEAPVILCELAQTIIKVTNSSSKIIFQSNKDKPPARSIYVPNVSRFHNEFEIKDKTSINEGIKLTEPWFRSL